MYLWPGKPQCSYLVRNCLRIYKVETLVLAEPGHTSQANEVMIATISKVTEEIAEDMTFCKIRMYVNSLHIKLLDRYQICVKFIE